jgi:hypothetical protein
LVAVDRGPVERRGVQVQHAAAELAGQLQEPRQVEHGRAEADLRLVVVLGTAGTIVRRSRAANPVTTIGQFCEVFHDPAR